MRDPFEELKSLDVGSPSPLPPQEVRRRGDRMRRRRTAFQAIGAAAAVLVVVSGGAFASGELTGTSPMPGPATQHPVPKPSGAPPDKPAPPSEPEPDGPPYLLGVEDLRAATGVEEWQVAADGPGPMVCAEESTEALAGDRTDTRYFEARKRGQVKAIAVATVLDFSPSSWAEDGYARAVDWLTTCDAPTDRKHVIASAGEAYGQVHDGRSEDGPWTWRTVMTSAPEICVECDAAWNNHQAVALGGERLVLLQVSYAGDMQGSVDESQSPMPKLLKVAARLAAQQWRSPDEVAAEAFGPTGAGKVQLGMSMKDLEISGVLRSELEECVSFDTTNLPGRNNGYASKDKGVVMILGDRSSRTPEGVGFGATRDEVEAAYGPLQPNQYGVEALAGVPGHSGTSYSFGFDDRGRVSEMLLLRDDQDCVG